MKLICAWCNSLISETKHKLSAVSHGVCCECTSKILSEPKGLVRTFLDQLEYPVLLIDAQTNMYLENSQLKDLVGKTSIEIEGKKSGEVFNCINWQESGECGSTIHCRDCTIRQAIEETFTSGTPLLDIKGGLKTTINGSEQEADCVISTQKTENYVLLTIHDFSFSR